MLYRMVRYNTGLSVSVLASPLRSGTVGCSDEDVGGGLQSRGEGGEREEGISIPSGGLGLPSAAVLAAVLSWLPKVPQLPEVLGCSPARGRLDLDAVVEGSVIGSVKWDRVGKVGR